MKRCENHLSDQRYDSEIRNVIQVLHTLGEEYTTKEHILHTMPQLKQALNDGDVCEECADHWVETELEWHTLLGNDVRRAGKGQHSSVSSKDESQGHVPSHS